MEAGPPPPLDLFSSQFLVSVSKENSSASEVLDSLSQSVHVKPENLRLAEVIKNRFHRVFLPSHSLDTVSPSDTLLCFELLSPELAKERVVVLEVQQVSKASPQVPPWEGAFLPGLALLSQTSLPSAPRCSASPSPSVQPASGSSSLRMRS